MTMNTRRMIGHMGLTIGVIAPAIFLIGCGGGRAGDTAGPNPEVKIVPPVDAQGKAYSIEDETKSPSRAK
jgi:hypothetical protein